MFDYLVDLKDFRVETETFIDNETGKVLDQKDHIQFKSPSGYWRNIDKTDRVTKIGKEDLKYYQ